MLLLTVPSLIVMEYCFYWCQINGYLHNNYTFGCRTSFYCDYIMTSAVDMCLSQCVISLSLYRCASQCVFSLSLYGCAFRCVFSLSLYRCALQCVFSLSLYRCASACVVFSLLLYRSGCLLQKLRRKWFARWVVNCLVGIGTAVVATFIEYFIEVITKYKFLSLTKCILELLLLLLLLFIYWRTRSTCVYIKQCSVGKQNIKHEKEQCQDEYTYA